MAEKKTPMPVDNPLSRAYLREFRGWSTAYAPGLSDPSTLREMENCWITRAGALSIRPAMRSVFPAGSWITTNYNAKIVGSFETFFLNDGTKALLFATRESTGIITFKVAAYTGTEYTVMSLAAAGFTGTTTFSPDAQYVRYIQIDNKIFALADSTNPADTARIFYVGETKKIVEPQEITVPDWVSTDALTVRLPDAAWINDPNKITIPSAETNTAGTVNEPLTGTLIDSDAVENVYNFGYFWTAENELGETAGSQMTVVKTKRSWSQWQFQSAAASGGPSGTNVTDPAMACDQLVAFIPSATWDALMTMGPVRWKLYMVTWADDGVVPVEGTLVGEMDLDPATATRSLNGWLAHTPIGASFDTSVPLPSGIDRINYSKPSSASQGIVSGDRITLVNDRQEPAVIRWSSNQLGEYTNFSASKGGGFKTLTSGNLLVPACVKLWQNPQSVDTLVVLCRGVDGYSTSYYMAPAEITGQTSSTSIMGFEETTATPGTVSPWGVEVVNQGLYHPLDDMLMKSTASNYNISHTSMTDDISNSWLDLLNKQNIVSSHFDNRIYYVVHNPAGAPLEDGCLGNEIWVLDVLDKKPKWSRWLIQCNSLHRLELANRLYMAVVRPDAIFVLDDLAIEDEFSESGGTNTKAIPWKAITNTQGTTRAHDAWAHLHQLTINLGNFYGKLRWGIRGLDVNGKRIERAKITKDLRPLDLTMRPLPWDIEDDLLIRRSLVEWEFFAESVETAGVVEQSYGQINMVAYRYTPASKNVGYERGSIETLQYGQAAGQDITTMYPNGVAAPYIDRQRGA